MFALSHGPAFWREINCAYSGRVAASPGDDDVTEPFEQTIRFSQLLQQVMLEVNFQGKVRKTRFPRTKTQKALHYASVCAHSCSTRVLLGLILDFPSRFFVNCSLEVGLIRVIDAELVQTLDLDSIF